MEDNKEILVEVNNVSKKFCKDLKLSLQYGLIDSIKAILPIKKSDNISLRKKEFWAVKNISFTLRRGECIGLIGHNGAGKSTLLKIINGLILPDTGSITMRGKVGALIELGAGFNPILTGRENIYNNAAILGFSKSEVDEKIQSIIAFSEIEDFIDSPVQNYSSGMKVRLGFAVAVHLQPDVLIIDEVLAVGDLGFVLKCFQKIDELLPHTAVIFVSHSMPMVSRICNQIVLMDHGEALYQGIDVGQGINLYYNMFGKEIDSNVVFTDNSLELTNSFVENKDSEDGYYSLLWNETITCVFDVKLKEDIEKPYISFALYDKEQRGVAEAFPLEQNLDSVFKKGEIIRYRVLFKGLILSKGIYYLTFTASTKKNGSPLFKIHKAINFKVTESEQIWTPFLLNSRIIPE